MTGSIITKDYSETLVSVYIPTHNRPELAARAIQSVIDQSYENIEIIVSDDGSDWDSYAGVRELLEENGASYHRNAEPMGACAARNKAIMLATGRLITGLDDDDEFARDHIANLLSSYDGKYSFVAASYLQVNTKGRKKKRYDVGEVTLDAQLHYNRVGNQVLTETSKLKSIGMFDESMPAMQDYDIWIRLLRDFGPGLKLPDCTYIQHIEHELGRISDQSGKLSDAYSKLRLKHKALYTKSHLETSKIMLSKISGKKLSFWDFCSCTNRHNWYLSATLYLNLTKKQIAGFLSSNY